MSESDFNDLLHAAEQLAAQVDGTGELPKVDRSLRQVLDASTELWSRVAQNGAQDIQAHLLLGSKGVNLPKITQKLETLSSKTTAEPIEIDEEPDIHTYLKNTLENAILTTIEESNKACAYNTEKMMWEDIEKRWREEKQKLFSSLLCASDEYLDFSVRAEMSDVNESLLTGSKSLLDHLEMAYAKVVSEYNKNVVQDVVQLPLLSRFLEMPEIQSDKTAKEIWEMVSHMTHIIPQVTDGPLHSRSSATFQQTLITQAKRHLEERYRLFLTSMVEANLAQARRGAIPGTYPLVTSFLRVHMNINIYAEEVEIVDGFPVWAVVYNCIRCGDLAAALHCVKKSPALEEFCSILEEVIRTPEGRRSSRVDSYFRFNYQRQIKKSPDFYKKAVFGILGACDISEEHSEVIKTADDYLWMKLSQICNSADGTKFSYPELQSLILEEQGESHYNASEQPMLYFSMLFLTGQFEAAIEFLTRTDKLKVHAVHIALVLNEQSILAAPPSIQTPLLSVEPDDDPPARRLNLARLIMLYVRKFEATNPLEALQYYYFLRNMKNADGKNLFMLCVSDLVMEARNFDEVLGYLESDGCRKPGYIDSFHGVQFQQNIGTDCLKMDVKDVIEMVAAEAERKGLFEEAIKLYDLAANQEKVLSLMSSLLSQVVHKVKKPNSLRSRLQEYAYSITNRYAGQPFSCASDTISTFIVLRDLLTFFDQYHAQEHQQALETISRSKLIPLSIEEVEERVTAFKRLGDEISRTIPNVLLATMNILHSLYIKAKGGDGISSPGVKRLEDSVRDKQLSYLREKARAITSFAGSVPYHMPGDTNSRLVQTEILMH
ncbi:nuclear pore complex protein Nup93-like isoform X1 [Schistocerca cancellata]|uniref:nuclear pore complex protein Nup93-like isoform X1 n=1 Tax=Schistocerca cancellata TaxID=274614 RepID=UPI002119347F|nr:nuclear pore complex protein Nup93-like isoform X1 [Schistocerca cancellata]XP_049773823.1 nuclear pore complex protein Nup93-like isoform X1 [Schistocerca cancellata]XP_049773824.1 nuclear pore complex protein Nup93-like isoform X1 [Schistocerca cancellata]XP_049773825.1 nuclear pore complex protein Nup93-like isoform X1 [Schistocerca cancellata]